MGVWPGFLHAQFPKFNSRLSSPPRPLHESPLTTDQAEAIRSYNQVTIQHTLLCGNRNRVWNRNSVFFFFNYLKYISGAPWLEGNCAYSNYLLLISLLFFSFFLFLFFFFWFFEFFFTGTHVRKENCYQYAHLHILTYFSGYLTFSLMEKSLRKSIQQDPPRGM